MFRNEESDMREKLVRKDFVECVIGLAPNLFYNSPMEACIVICRMTKKPDRIGKVLFINAVNDVERKNAQSSLTNEHIRKIADAYAGYKDVDGFAKVVTIKKIGENNFSLSIPLYVKPPVEASAEDELSLQQHYERWQVTSERAMGYYDLLNTMIQKGGENDG